MSQDLPIELYSAFVEEFNDYISQGEAVLLKLQGRKEESGTLDSAQNNSQDNSMKDAILDLFRFAHTMKGTSYSMGFKQLGDWVHLYEDVLVLIRDNALIVTADILNILISFHDSLRIYIKHLGDDNGYVLHNKQLEDALRSIAVNQCLPGNPTEPKTEPTHHNKTISDVKEEEAPKEVVKNNDKIVDEVIKVRLSRLDTLVDLVGELLTQSVILSRQLSEATTTSAKQLDTMNVLNALALDLQRVSFGLRMVPLEAIFQRMHKIVHDLGLQEKKEIDFYASGDQIELDKLVVDIIGEPLSHLIRNSIDHGIETPAERLKAGKNTRAKIRLSAKQQDDNVIICVQDDGKGIDTDIIRIKAIEKGLISDDSKLSEQELMRLIFLPGFSTAATVTDVSGRGVGMDVVDHAVQKLKGTIAVESKVGVGTKIAITLPLSLAVIDGLVVECSPEECIVPLMQCKAVLELDEYRIETLDNIKQIELKKDEWVPFYSIGSILWNTTVRSDTIGLVVHSSDKKVCYGVERISGQQRVVIKKFPSRLQTIPGLLGASVLGSGDMRVLLDLEHIQEGRA